MNAPLKTNLIQGSVILLSAFIGIWGGRETMIATAAVEQRVIKEAIKANTEAIARNSDQIAGLALQMAQLNLASARQEDRMRLIEQWRIEISALAASRGFELPDIRRRLEILEGKRR